MSSIEHRLSILYSQLTCFMERNRFNAKRLTLAAQLADSLNKNRDLILSPYSPEGEKCLRMYDERMMGLWNLE